MRAVSTSSGNWNCRKKFVSSYSVQRCTRQWWLRVRRDSQDALLDPYVESLGRDTRQISQHHQAVLVLEDVYRRGSENLLSSGGLLVAAIDCQLPLGVSEIRWFWIQSA